MTLLVYGLHALFWAPFVVRGHLDKLAGRQQTGEAAHASAAPSGLVWLHGFGIAATYAGLAIGASGITYPLPDAVRYVGVPVILGGMLLVIRTLMVFRSWRLRAEITADHELCTEGPFSVVRHPIYTAMVVLCLGSFLLMPNTCTLMGIFTTFGTGDYRARAEEKLLLGAFGDRYAKLMSRTRRFIPFVY